MKALSLAQKDFLADTETPVSAFLKLCHQQPYSFLFESAEGVDNVGRYSIVAWDPLMKLRLLPSQVVVEGNGGSQTRPAQEFFSVIRRLMAETHCPGLPALPFVGSWVGHLGWDLVRLLERLPAPAWPSLPLAQLCFCSRLVIFDHLLRRLSMVAIAPDAQQASEKLAEMQGRLRASLQLSQRPAKVEITPPPQERFISAVDKAKEYIAAGDIFQVVLSDQFSGRGEVDPLMVYRWLRVKNPSPYMFFLDLGDYQLAGASPETLVKTHEGLMQVRPIAGTRGRSRDRAEDRRLEQEMLDSPKERAEHLMLVDLARNDVGRVCRYGSVTVDPYFNVERYSHVMHIVSQVSGQLNPELDAFDALKAAFPAGTVSGAPKVRAMEIIDELEESPRGPYAGAVGRFGPGPEMDTCIAIRQVLFTGEEVTVQVGAGIVADSDPQMEFVEISQKAAQGIAALRAAAEETL